MTRLLDAGVAPQDGGPMDAATLRLLDARRHPGRRPVMRQSWEHLFFLHWRVDPAEVAKLLPAGLTVDTFEGQTYLGVIGFRMSQVRPIGLPALPWLSYFNELNVRVYVRDASGEPGVWFLSLDCDRWPAVRIARAVQQDTRLGELVLERSEEIPSNISMSLRVTGEKAMSELLAIEGSISQLQYRTYSPQQTRSEDVIEYRATLVRASQ